jgi:hypothetical protein
MYTSTQVADTSTLMARATSRVTSEPGNTLLVPILAKEAETLSADIKKRSWFGVQDETTNHGLCVIQAFPKVLQKLVDAHSAVALDLCEYSNWILIFDLIDWLECGGCMFICISPLMYGYVGLSSKLISMSVVSI